MTLSKELLGLDVYKRQMRDYAINAIYSIYTIDYAEEFAHSIGARVHKFKKGRGIIGAIAAIGIELNDETFECLAYRIPENYGTKRQLDEESIFLMNEKTYPETFDNIDIEGNYAAIEPHTPCPVLYLSLIHIFSSLYFRRISFNCFHNG